MHHDGRIKDSDSDSYTMHKMIDLNSDLHE